MENFQKIKIEDVEYFILDSLQNLNAEDSFIVKQNKLKGSKGNGEARKYVGSYQGPNGDNLSSFFNYDSWGKTTNGVRDYPFIQENNCFFSKSNLLKYLEDAKVEYQKQEQVYQQDISKLFDENLQNIINLDDEITYFSIYDVSDLRGAKQSRGYIRSDDKIWKIWRQLILPHISYLSILKLIPAKGHDLSKKPLFYFRIFLDYQFRSIVHPRLLESSTEIMIEERVKKVSAKSNVRIGVEAYRRKVIDKMGRCPFTEISDERLLIASHIKPYNVCKKEGRMDQAVDPLNGLALSPTYDKLFDQGYITFKDNGDLICGTLLSPYTWRKLNINPNAQNNFNIYPEHRQEYLEYHRKHVFQDNIDDFV